MSSSRDGEDGANRTSQLAQLNKRLDDEGDTEKLAKQLSEVLKERAESSAIVLYLRGDLGVGKTAFTRALLRGFGYEGNVKSPTYTLVEVYEEYQVNHFDLYRLSGPEELEFIGIEHYFELSQINIIEWPEKGEACLPSADIEVSIEQVITESQNSDTARNIKLESFSRYGESIIQQLAILVAHSEK